MKNIITIDMDSDRDEPIKITKPQEIVEGINDDESAKKMILEDMTTLCNALGTIIQLGGDNNYFDSEKSARLCIKYLNENFISNDDEIDETLKSYQ